METWAVSQAHSGSNYLHRALFELVSIFEKPVHHLYLSLNICYISWYPANTGYRDEAKILKRWTNETAPTTLALLTTHWHGVLKQQAKGYRHSLRGCGPRCLYNYKNIEIIMCFSMAIFHITDTKGNSENPFQDPQTLGEIKGWVSS